MLLLIQVEVLKNTFAGEDRFDDSNIQSVINVISKCIFNENVNIDLSNMHNQYMEEYQ